MTMTKLFEISDDGWNPDMTEGPWCQKLQEWVDAEKAAGRLIDFKLFPYRTLPIEMRPKSLEELAKSVYLTLTSTDSVDVTTENL